MRFNLFCHFSREWLAPLQSLVRFLATFRNVPSLPLRSITTTAKILAGLLFCCVITCGGLFAQDSKKSDPKPPEVKAADSVLKPENLVYLPYKEFSAVLDKKNSTVFLPYAQFLELWQRARPISKDASAPLVQSVITQANYMGKIENNLARIEATFKIKVLDKAWGRVALKFGDAAVGKMTADNEQILLVGTGEGTYDLLLPTVGEHTVKLELVTRVHTSTDGKSFDLEVPLVGISNLDLTIPSPDQTVDVVPHLVSTSIEAAANSTKITANVGSTNKLTARWFPRVSKTPEMELLTSVSNQIHAHVADGLVQTEAILTYQVLRGELNQVVVAIPLGHRILDVTVPNLKGWKAANEANRQVITIDLLGTNAKTIPVEIRTERSATGEILELGGIEEDGKVLGIHAVGAVRESGVIVVGHGPELSLSVEQQRGLMRIEAAEVPEGQRRPENLYFKFYNPAFRLGVSAKPVEPRVTVNHGTVLEFTDDELKLISNLDYNVERAGVFELKYTIPEGVKIDSVDCEHKQEFAVTPDGKTLTLTLKQKTQGNIRVAVRGHLSFTNGMQTQELKLPILEPVNVAREQGTVQVYAPEAIEVVTDEKGLVSVQPDRAADQQARPNMRLASAWTFNRRPIEIPVSTVRKPTRLTAEIGTKINVNREIVEITSQVAFNVQYAGIDTFRIAVPAAVSDNVQIEVIPGSGGVPIKQKSHAEAQNGWVTWTINTQREVVGKQVFRVKYDLKLTKQNQTAKITVQPIRVFGVLDKDGATERVPVTNLLGEIAVQKDRLWSLAAVPKDLQTIDVRELTLMAAEGALAYRYSQQVNELALSATEHEIQEVVQTVISRSLIEMVLTQDDSVTFRCRYVMKTSERQRLQLELPAKVQPLGVMVAGKQVNLERSPANNTKPGSELYYVNVARAGASDQQFSMTIVYRIPGYGLPTTGFGGDLNFDLPQLGATTNQQAVVVQQLRVAVWVPEQLTLVGTPDHFTPDRQLRFVDAFQGRSGATKSTADLEHWIGETGSGLFEFPTAGHAYVYNNLGGAGKMQLQWWRTSWNTWVWSISLLLIALILRGTSWENKFGVLLVCGFAIVLFALSNAELAMFIASSARFGLQLLLLVWIVHLFLRKRVIKETPKEPVVIDYGPEFPAAVIPPPGVFDDVRDDFNK
ncbi:MAG: hypothetical protein JWM11_3683 [Planctomycetaceae bacterium]|nr:hypothetical protein [Planctomycetaceae bacterium]